MDDVSTPGEELEQPDAAFGRNQLVDLGPNVGPFAIDQAGDRFQNREIVPFSVDLDEPNAPDEVAVVADQIRVEVLPAHGQGKRMRMTPATHALMPASVAETGIGV